MNDKVIDAYMKVITEAAMGREIPDDADFETEMKNAIEAKELVTFKYTKKDGGQYKMTARPYQFLSIAGKPAVKAYLNGVEDKPNERMLYIGSMGAGASVQQVQASAMYNTISDKPTDEMKQLEGGVQALLDNNEGFKVGKNPYFTATSGKDWKKIAAKLHVNYPYLKPVGYSTETNQVALECSGAVPEVRTSTDGDYDDGRQHSWTTETYLYYPDGIVCGYIWGELRDGIIYVFNDIPLQKTTGTCMKVTKTKDRWFGGRRW